MRHFAVITTLLLSGCSTVPENAAVVQAVQVRAALENRHGWTPATYDESYSTTSLDELWQANVNSWRHEAGGWDCEDNADALLLQLRISAVKRGDSCSPAAFLMPSLMRDGRRHAVIVALTETSHGAEWVYWDPLENRQLGRSEILRPLSTL